METSEEKWLEIFPTRKGPSAILNSEMAKQLYTLERIQNFWELQLHLNKEPLQWP